MKKLLILTLIVVLSPFAFSQKAGVSSENNLVQFSGVVVDADSLKPIPFVSIFIKNSKHGTVSDYYGYFSLVAGKNDTIFFMELGYRRAMFIIPDTLTTNRYSLIQMLKKDTIELEAAVIYPWPTREQFKQVFLSTNIPDDNLARAQKNLAMEAMRNEFESMTMDGNMNYKFRMDQQYSRLYYAGQYPSITVLNPIAWTKFIEAWKRGDFKKK